MKRIPGQTVKAAGIFLLATDQDPPHFLLMRHRDRWDLPKGHCEADESFQEAALRETQEETGIPAESIALDKDFRFDLRYQTTYKQFADLPFDKHLRFFLGYLDHQPALRLTEHESADWFAWNPPHQIQAQTIDPLLAAVAAHLDARRNAP